MRVLFFASGEFALESLRSLSGSAHTIAGVVTRPDRPAGRGRRTSATPVAIEADGLGLPVHKPGDLRDRSCCSFLGDSGWQAGVVAAYGGLIPGWMLGGPAHGFVNLHPSLLPRYRGAAPIRRAIMAGASGTGVTTIAMSEALDAGDILLQREVPVEDDDTFGTLAGRLSRVGAALLVETLDRVQAGGVTPVSQDGDRATWAPPIRPEDGNIDWSLPAETIERLVRALEPVPGAFTFFRGRRLKIRAVRLTEVPREDEPGTLTGIGKEGFLVNTGTTCLRMMKVQPEGRPAMTAAEFSRGRRPVAAESFSRVPRDRGA